MAIASLCWFGVAACSEGQPIGATGLSGTIGPATPSDSTGGDSDDSSPAESGEGEGEGSTTGTVDPPDDTGDSGVGDCMPGTTEDCYTGAAGTEDVGTCVGGTRTCDDDGSWGACEGEVTPDTEACDGLDNSCDGNVDETCDCTPTHTQECYGRDMSTLGVGECVAGTQVCDSTGSWGPCEDDVTPTDELCNGLDDDCDDETDEDNPEGGAACNTGLLGECSAGLQTCVDTSVVCVQVTPAAVETCDGLDNNCDGTADEGNPEGGGACSTGLQGVCAAGILACNLGDLECEQSVTSSSETCDNLDNDCDGSTDEGNPDGGAACSTGQPGVCGAGTMTCSGGGLSCQQNVAAGAETCDTLDNDCDGSVDEDFWVDASNGGVDFPDIWSVSIPLIDTYPATGAGVMAGRLLPEGDNDWFTFYAVEDLADIFGDTPVKGALTITSPGAGLWYEVCACWSTAATYCGKDQTGTATCVTSQNGNPAALQVNMSMNLGSTDTGYLDVVIRPDIPSIDYDCDEWGLTWTIWE